MAYLQEHRLIDINHSTIDKKKSDPATGTYEFIEKKYVSYQDPEVRPEWRFEWCRYLASNNYSEYTDMQRKWKASKVKVEDGFWPEGLGPDSSGAYTTGDVVLVKYPLRIYIERRKHEIKMSEGATRAIINRHKSEAKADGVDLDDNLIRNM